MITLLFFILAMIVTFRKLNSPVERIAAIIFAVLLPVVAGFIAAVVLLTE